MGLFSGRTAPQVAVGQGRSTLDQLILEIGNTAEELIRNALQESRDSSNHIRHYLAEQRAADAAWWSAHRRQQTEELERASPEHRE